MAWSKENEKFLLDKWGILTIENIAKRLNRTVDAVLIKSNLIT